MHENVNFCCRTFQGLNQSDKNIECLWIQIQSPFMKKITVAVVYRPPNGSTLQFK